MDSERRRLAEDEARRPGVHGWVEAEPGQAHEGPDRAPTRASSRARCMPRQTCGPWANAAWSFAFARRTSNRCGSGEHDGSRFAPASETRTSSRRPIARRRRARRRASHTGRRRRRPARAARTPRRRSEPALGRVRAPFAPHRSRGRGREVRDHRRPSSRSLRTAGTAAFETTSRPTEGARTPGGGAEQRRDRLAVEHRLERTCELTERRAPLAGRLDSGGDVRHGRDDRRDTSRAVRPREGRRGRGPRPSPRRQRPAQRLAEICLARPGRRRRAGGRTPSRRGT